MVIAWQLRCKNPAAKDLGQSYVGDVSHRDGVGACPSVVEMLWTLKPDPRRGAEGRVAQGGPGLASWRWSDRAWVKPPHGAARSALPFSSRMSRSPLPSVLTLSPTRRLPSLSRSSTTG